MSDRVDFLEDVPAVGQIVCRVIVLAFDVTDKDGRVDPQTVDAAVVQPHPYVVSYVLLDFRAPEIRASAAPRRFGSPIVIKINATLVVFVPAVELPKVHVAVRAEMVVNDI